MSTNEKFLTQRQRYQPVMLPQDFSDEEMARDWTLTTSDLLEIERYRARFRLFISLQICAVRLYGRFIQDIGSVSPRIVSYLNNQLSLPPSLTVASPEREATLAEQRKNILTYLGFTRYDENIQSNLKLWLVKQAEKGFLPDALFLRAEQYLLSSRVILPGPTIIERLIISTCAQVHERMFDTLYKQLSAGIKQTIDDLLVTLPGDQRSLFYLLKESPPSAGNDSNLL
ncbi:DUF4158 domain-containing protein, partial [Escherichia coli]|nr:DUF4158 domain-containing protein [Escherichia coli]